MQTTLKKYGANSQAIVIPKAILDLFKINSDTKFNIEIENDRLIISPASKNEEKFQESWAEVSSDFSDVFKSLADK